MPYQRRPNLTPEQIEDVKQDLASGKKRGQICKDRGYTYQQLQKALGFAWKKKPTNEAAQEIVEPETKHEWTVSADGGHAALTPEQIANGWPVPRE